MSKFTGIGGVRVPERTGYIPAGAREECEPPGAEVMLFRRRCDRCGTVCLLEQPCIATVFYCSIMCAD